MGRYGAILDLCDRVRNIGRVAMENGRGWGEQRGRRSIAPVRHSGSVASTYGIALVVSLMPATEYGLNRALDFELPDVGQK